MPDIDTLPTYGAVRAAYVRDREQQQRRHTRGIPTDAQRAQWAAEFDRWADAIRLAAWDEAVAVLSVGDANAAIQEPDNPYRED